MIKPFLIIATIVYWGHTCSQKKQVAAQVSVPVPIDSTKVKVDFEADIKPILLARCTPCHFPGGKMYGRLPFDNPQTIKDHPAGVFKRIKDPGEVKKLKVFIAQTP